MKLQALVEFPAEDYSVGIQRLFHPLFDQCECFDPSKYITQKEHAVEVKINLSYDSEDEQDICDFADSVLYCIEDVKPFASFGRFELEIPSHIESILSEDAVDVFVRGLDSTGTYREWIGKSLGRIKADQARRVLELVTENAQALLKEYGFTKETISLLTEPLEKAAMNAAHDIEVGFPSFPLGKESAKKREKLS